MRVSNTLVTQSIVGRLQDAQRNLLEAQIRATSGKKVAILSDDPTAGSTIMQLDGGLRGVEQYVRNVGTVKARLDAEDGALSQITDILGRVRELATAANSDNVDDAGRRTIGVEVRQLMQQVVSIGNTKVGDEFLFGGQAAAQAPFDLSQEGQTPPFAVLTTPAPPAVGVPIAQGERVIEVSPGQTMRTAHPGKTVFLDSGVLTGMRALADALDPAGAAVPPTFPNGRATARTDAMAQLDGAFAVVQGYVGEVGARQNQADMFAGALESLKATYTEQRSDLAEVDLAEAITTMSQRQMAYQAAMLASSKVMGLSLTDYLR